MLFLNDGPGQDLTPGEMMQGDVLELALVDLGGMDAICHRRLIGDREQGLKSVSACYLQIMLRLLAL
jgi:hypothetical protein